MRENGFVTFFTVIFLAATFFTSSTSFAADIPNAVRTAKVFWVQPPPDLSSFTVTVSKKDLNWKQGPEDLSILLYDPARRLVATGNIPDAQNNQIQSANLTVTTPTSGSYRLVLVTKDVDADFVVGVTTTSPGIVVEEDSILLYDPTASGSLYFSPPEESFNVTLNDLHETKQTVVLKDATNTTVLSCDFTAAKEQTFQVNKNTGNRTGLWYFEMPKMDISMSIQGVSFWTLNPNKFFFAQKTKWMLFPYRETRYLLPNQSADLTYTLRNDTGADATFNLNVNCPSELQCSIVSPQSPVTITKQGSVPVKLHVTTQSSAQQNFVYWGFWKATSTNDTDITQSAGIRINVDNSTVANSLDLPIVLDLYKHENFQFGYAPDYETNEVYFDRNNRPFIRNRTTDVDFTSALTVLVNSIWETRPFTLRLQSYFSDFKKVWGGAGWLGAKIAFDADNNVYTLLRVDTNSDVHMVLLYSKDVGQTYAIYEFSGNIFDIEQFTGHNTLDSPPPILAYEKRNEPSDGGPVCAPNKEYCFYYDLKLYLPEKNSSGLQIGDPILVSKDCIGPCTHSGGAAATVTKNGKTHIIWGDVAQKTDAGVAKGVPTYIATYDHASKKLGEKVFLAYAPPFDDSHNAPAITIDSQGYLHAVTGAHAENFYYLRSLVPNDAYSGWTNPEVILDYGYVDETTDADGVGKQTYVSLVCDPDDTLHIAYRHGRLNYGSFFQDERYSTLAMQSKPKGQPWSSVKTLVVPPVPEYSIYYHKLTIDRIGNLYLSYSYYTQEFLYQLDYPPGRYHNRAMLVSSDRGQTWKLAETSDFVFEEPQPDGGVTDGDLDSGKDDGPDIYDALSDKTTERGIIADSGCSCDTAGQGKNFMWILLFLIVAIRQTIRHKMNGLV